MLGNLLLDYDFKGSEGSSVCALETYTYFVQLHSIKGTWQGAHDQNAKKYMCV
jgi:hypothetical protein